MTPAFASLPIACSLTAAELGRRLDEVDQLARKALLRRESIDGGVRLTFVGDVRARLDTFVAAERACCPFLDLRLSSDGNTHVLQITGPGEAAPMIDELFRGDEIPDEAIELSVDPSL
jgi:hypothetical protein